ncbi:MAG: hypothetical protein FJW30_08540 [Acidobacteria bacterium]|nr:hypothetical protein [Acidobacteriota bacterium]
MNSEFERATIEELMREMRTANHPTEEQIEKYTMGRLAEPHLADFEEHLLVCERCQRRLSEADGFLVSVRSALKTLEPELHREPAWRAWFRPDWILIPVPVLGALAAAALAIVAWQPWKGSEPLAWQSTTLAAYRGGEAGKVVPSMPVRLTLQTDGLPAGPAEASVVSSEGATQATARIELGATESTLELARGLDAGIYWVRIRQNGQILREYSLAVRAN